MKKYFQTEDQIFEVRGEKSAQFLHGQLTNSITDLAINQCGYNLFLNRKGKIQADLYVIRKEGSCLLLIPENFSEVIISHLKKLAPLSRCEIQKVEGLKVLHVFDTDDFEECYQTDRLGVSGWDVLVEAQLVGFEEMTESEREKTRIQNGVVQVGIDVTEKNLPQEGRLERALHFKKGCYLGQEVVARLHYRGHVNKLVKTLVSKDKGFQIGDELTLAEKSVGKVTSVFEDDNQTWLLGFVPYKHQEPGTIFNVGDKSVKIFGDKI